MRARYAADRLGSAPEVVIVLPDGEEISSADPAVCMPGFRSWSATRSGSSRHVLLPMRMHTGRRERPRPRSTRNSGSPRTSRCLTSACSAPQARRIESLRHASRFAFRRLSGARDHSRQSGSDGRPHAGSDFDVRRFRPNLVVETEPGDELPENSCATPTSTCLTQVCTARSPRCVASCLPASSASCRQTSK